MDRVTVMPQTQIDYAPASPIHQQRRVRRLAIWIAAIALLAFLCVEAGPAAWRRVQLLYWQQEAASYSSPREQVVFDNRPVTDGSEELPVSLPGGMGRDAIPAARFYSILSPPGHHPMSTLFLHARKNSLGETRLVHVVCQGTFPRPFVHPGDPDLEVMIVAWVYRPGSLFTEPLELNNQLGQSPFFELHTNGARLRLYAGQVETDDPSHFSIVCELGDKRSVIDGWVMNNDMVKLEQRR